VAAEYETIIVMNVTDMDGLQTIIELTEFTQ